MDKNLLFNALVKFSLGLLLVAALLFVPAGTAGYWNAWLFMGVLFFPMALLGLFLAWKSPELLRKRLRSKEQQGAQRQVVALSAVMFLGGFLAAGLSFRFRFLLLPRGASLAGVAVFLLGYGLYAQVMRENVWLSRTVEVQEGQQVVDTGLYGIVRHPMYTSTVLLFLSIPVILGAGAAVLFFLPYPLLIARRIQNEEAVLEEGLPGYREYKKRVKYRLLPWVW